MPARRSPLIVLIASLVLTAGVGNAQQLNPSDRRKAHIVSRVYQATDGGIEMCRRIAPGQAEKVEEQVERFRNAYPELMSLVRNSPFLDAAKRQNAQQVEDMAALVVKNPALGTCDDLIAMVRQFVEHPSGKQGVASMVTELQK